LKRIEEDKWEAWGNEEGEEEWGLTSPTSGEKHVNDGFVAAATNVVGCGAFGWT
jgi:hypothetical protein